MSVVKYLKNSGWAAIAAATVLSAMPAAAAPEDRGGRSSASQSQGSRGSQRESAAPRQSPQPRVERGGGERPAREQRQAQVAQRGEQRPQASPSRGERPQAVPSRGEQRPQATPRRDPRPNGQSTRPAGQQVAQQSGGRGEQARPSRNVTYADRTRDRTYGGRGDRDRDGTRGQQDRRDGDRDGRWQSDRRDGDRDGRWQRDRRDSDRERWSGNRDRYGRWQGDGRYGRWDNRWRNNSRYDWHRYRSYNRNIFHVGVYYSPYSHYSYRRLGIGYALDSLFFGSRYWINDPWQYRLPAVYGPYRWVRYYDDVLLVDIYSGEVVDVIYDFFW